MCHLSHQHAELCGTGPGPPQWLRHPEVTAVAHGPILPKAKLLDADGETDKAKWVQGASKQRPCPVNGSGFIYIHQIT